MKEILVLLLALNTSLVFAQVKLSLLKKGEGKRYTAIFLDGKGAEYSVYLSDFKPDSNGDRYFVECQVKALDGVTPFRFWQQYEWRIKPGYVAELLNAYVFSVEMTKPQKYSLKEMNPDIGIPLTQSMVHPYTPFELLSKRSKKDFELKFKDNIKSRPTIINPSKADALDEKGKEILGYSYSCL